MSKEIFNSDETLLAAKEIINVSNSVLAGDISSLEEITDESIRNIVKNGITYHRNNTREAMGTIGATTGGGLGIASSFGLITLMAAEGTAGAAVVTSGLAAIGSIVGGGMLAGLSTILVFPISLAAIGAITFTTIASKGKKKRNGIKRQLLTEAQSTRKKLEMIISSSTTGDNEFKLGILLSLQALTNDLQRDIS